MKLTSSLGILSAVLLVAAGLGFPAAPVRAQSDYITTVENTPNLLGYWRYTPTSQANSEVNGYTGTFMGDAGVGAPGSGPMLADDPANSPVSLDGTNNSFVNTSLTGQIDQQGSIVGWFNLAALPSTAGHIFDIAGEAQVGNDFGIAIFPDNSLRFYTDNGSFTADPTALTAADLNTWIFVAATFTANQDRNIYINGALVASSVPGGHSSGNGAFQMGNDTVFGPRLFNGALDEIAVYNRDLSATEIANIYDSRNVAVPEPASWGLILAGLGLLAGLQRGRFFRRRV